MKAKITGYFKFRPIAEAEAKIPSGSVAELLVKHAAGKNGWLTAASAPDAWNSVVGRCAELGWYRNGGWMPNGRVGGGGGRAADKARGDILGVCVSFGECSKARTWLYCDLMLENAMKEMVGRGWDLGFHLTSQVVEMERIPDQEWIDGFCLRTDVAWRKAVENYNKAYPENPVTYPDWHRAAVRRGKRDSTCELPSVDGFALGDDDLVRVSRAVPGGWADYSVSFGELVRAVRGRLGR